MIFKLYKKLPQHLKVASISWVSRGVFVLTSLYNLKLATGLLNVNQFAIYAILTNIVTWLLLVDVGVGYSIQNFISELKAKKENFNEYIFIGLAITYFIGTLILLNVFVFNNYFAIVLLKNILENNSHGRMEINKLFLYSTVCGVLTGIGMVSHKIFYAKQKGYWPNILSAMSSIITLTILIVFKNFNLHDLFWVVMVFFLPNVFISFGPSVYFFISSYMNCYKVITISNIKIIVKKLSFRGLSFFVFTLTSALVLQIDYLVMSQTVPASQISLYNIIFKIYNAFFLIYSTLLLALWPSIAEWYVNKDFVKIKHYTRQYILIGIIFILSVSAFFAIKSDLVFNLISSLKFNISVITIMLFAIYFSVRVWTDTYALILQSTSMIKSLWIFTPIQALLSFCFQVFLSKIFGINGILMGLILSFIFTVVWGLPYQVSKILK